MTAREQHGQDLLLVMDAIDRHAIDGHACPLEACAQPAGIACLRSGGAVVGGSARRRWGEYVHVARRAEAERVRAT